MSSMMLTRIKQPLQLYDSTLRGVAPVRRYSNDTIVWHNNTSNDGRWRSQQHHPFIIHDHHLRMSWYGLWNVP